MQNLSTNAVGVSSLIAAFIMLFFKVEVDTVTIEIVITGLLAGIGIFNTVRNQWNRPDVKNFFLKK